MNHKNIFQLSIIVIGLLSFCTVFAQNPQPANVITTAVPFLRISTDARAGGMADVGVATSPGVNAVYFNPAKLSFTENRGAIAANYTPWLKEWANDMYISSVSGYYKIDEQQAFHASVNYFNLGDLQFADNNGNHLQSFHPREWGVSAGYSRKISDRSGVGLSLKFIYSNLANKGVDANAYQAGTAGAVDLGYYYNGLNNQGNGWSFGAALTNLGSKINYSTDASQKDFIPANLTLGAAWSKAFNEQNKITFALDINKLLVPTPPYAGDSAGLVAYRNKSVVSSWFSSFGDATGGFSEELKEFQVALGAEYWYNNQFALRAGYSYESPQKGNRTYFTAGASIKYSLFTINFSYLSPITNSANKTPLANTMRFGLVLDFPKVEK